MNKRINEYPRIKGHLEHRVIWENHHNKKIPKGYNVHHINGDKKDSRIENLQLVDTLTHKRIHSGCIVKNGVWYKPCRKCGELKVLNDWFYERKKGEGISPWCKDCLKKNAIKNTRKKNSEMKNFWQEWSKL